VESIQSLLEKHFSLYKESLKVLKNVRCEKCACELRIRHDQVVRFPVTQERLVLVPGQHWQEDDQSG
jgi:hypothetical protein